MGDWFLRQIARLARSVRSEMEKQDRAEQRRRDVRDLLDEAASVDRQNLIFPEAIDDLRRELSLAERGAR